MTSQPASAGSVQPPISNRTQAFLTTAQVLASQLSAASSHPQASGDPIPQHQVQLLLAALPALSPENQPAALIWLTLRAAHSAPRAIELFEELQLRAGLAQTYPTFNRHGEQAWRAAAQTRLLLQTDLTPLQTTLASPVFWQSPDTNWLASIDPTHEYLNKESFEALLPLLAFPTQSKQSPQILSTLEEAGYKLTAFLLP